MTTEEFRAVMQAEFDSVRSELNNVQTGLRAAIAETRAEVRNEGETTRRHFDIMDERVSDSVRLVAEVNVHHSTVLDDYEARLQKIDKR